MDKLSVGLAADTIVRMAGSGEITACSLDSMDLLANMGLSARVEAAIEEAGLSYGPSLAVTVQIEEKGKVRLHGTVGDEYNKVRADRVVKGVEKVDSIDNRQSHPRQSCRPACMNVSSILL